MVKDIICPHCKKNQNVQAGLKSDDDLNVICQHCSKIILCIMEEEPYAIPIATAPTHYHNQVKKELLPISSQEEIIID